jgi:nitrogen fixation NifU-like protein
MGRGNEDEKIKQAMLDMLFEKTKGHFSKKVMECGTKPTRYGEIAKPDGHSRVSSDCGDTIEMFLRMHRGRIEDVRFRSEGCMTTVAVAQAAAEMAAGKTVRECLSISHSTILEYLGGLPAGNEHCADLASRALHRALRDYAVHRKGP